MSEDTPIASPSSTPAPGQLLAEAREARGWSVNEVAMRLKFAPRQIEALEADAYNALPGSTIVRGMVRSYARALGLDPQPLVSDLEHRLNAEPITLLGRGMQVPFSEAKKGTRLYAALSVIVLLAVVGLGVQWWLEESGTLAAKNMPANETEPDITTAPPVSVDAPVEPVDASISPANAVAPDARASFAAPTPGNKRIEFAFDAAAWVEVTDSTGKILLAQLNPAQTQTTVEGKPPFALTVGNAPSVRVTYQGASVDLRSSIRDDIAHLKLD